jgi:hypothetical protein
VSSNRSPTRSTTRLKDDLYGPVREGLRSAESAADRGVVSGEAALLVSGTPRRSLSPRSATARQARDEVLRPVAGLRVEEPVDHPLDPVAIPGDGVRRLPDRTEPG